MGWRPPWPMGHGSHGSWVKSSMGRLGHGSLWVTHSLLCTGGCVLWLTVTSRSSTVQCVAGSVLGPLLYILYTAKLTRHGLHFHMYADNKFTLVHPLRTSLAFTKFTVCVVDVNDWLLVSRLRLSVSCGSTQLSCLTGSCAWTFPCPRLVHYHV